MLYDASQTLNFGRVSHLMYVNISGNVELIMTMVHIPPNNFVIATGISVVFRNLVLDTVSKTKFRNTVLRIDFLIHQIRKIIV